MIIGTGIDIIEIERVKKAIERWGHHFIDHIYTSAELEYVQQFKNPYAHYAVRFAAKEAVFKALERQQGVSWKDIEILNASDGRPYCELHRHSIDRQKILISLSHSKYYAVASAIITTTDTCP